ncbi:hypothetical protein HAX54_023869 [Datura stramonium]|uniref:Uncharacterized protein n=1 Tax=Datura stramonium TaxID=4076 RepID=A0ABS8RJY2_DATST|nr:hypothetical protein [Datura stramonium]
MLALSAIFLNLLLSKQLVNSDPTGLEKVVLKFRSVNNMVIAPASTGSDNKSGNAVTRTDHTNRAMEAAVVETVKAFGLPKRMRPSKQSLILYFNPYFKINTHITGVVQRANIVVPYGLTVTVTSKLYLSASMCLLSIPSLSSICCLV